jgi:hypothetical protein
MIDRTACDLILDKACGHRWDHWSNDAKRVIALDAMQSVVDASRAELLAEQAQPGVEAKEYLRLHAKYVHMGLVQPDGGREQPKIDRSNTPEVLRKSQEGKTP